MMPDFPIPDPGPFGWATLGAIVLKAIDLGLYARVCTAGAGLPGGRVYGVKLYSCLP